MDLVARFQQHYRANPQWLSSAPGHAHLLGEHLDSSLGLALTAATDHHVRVAAMPVQPAQVDLLSLDLGTSLSFRLEGLSEPRLLNRRSLPAWARSAVGVARALQSAGLAVSGLQAAFTSHLPFDAGLGAEAGLAVALTAIWQSLAGWQLSRFELAQVCQCAAGGDLVDYLPAACGQAGTLLLLDRRNQVLETIPFPPECALVLADSGVRFPRAAAAHRRRQAAVDQALRRLRQVLPGLEGLRDLSTVEFAAYSDFLPPVQRRRAEHVVKENQRVQMALDALLVGDARLFGGLLFAGHGNLHNLYQVSCPELDTLVALARDLPGCYGARLTGPGFGGCTVNLVVADQASAFIQGLQAGYLEAAGNELRAWSCHPASGVSVQSF